MHFAPVLHSKRPVAISMFFITAIPTFVLSCLFLGVFRTVMPAPLPENSLSILNPDAAALMFHPNRTRRRSFRPAHRQLRKRSQYSSFLSPDFDIHDIDMDYLQERDIFSFELFNDPAILRYHTDAYGMVTVEPGPQNRSFTFTYANGQMSTFITRAPQTARHREESIWSVKSTYFEDDSSDAGEEDEEEFSISLSKRLIYLNDAPAYILTIGQDFVQILTPEHTTVAVMYLNFNWDTSNVQSLNVTRDTQVWRFHVDDSLIAWNVAFSVMTVLRQETVKTSAITEMLFLSMKLFISTLYHKGVDVEDMEIVTVDFYCLTLGLRTHIWGFILDTMWMLLCEKTTPFSREWWPKAAELALHFDRDSAIIPGLKRIEAYYQIAQRLPFMLSRYNMLLEEEEEEHIIDPAKMLATTFCVLKDIHTTREDVTGAFEFARDTWDLCATMTSKFSGMKIGSVLKVLDTGANGSHQNKSKVSHGSSVHENEHGTEKDHGDSKEGHETEGHGHGTKHREMDLFTYCKKRLAGHGHGHGHGKDDHSNHGHESKIKLPAVLEGAKEVLDAIDEVVETVEKGEKMLRKADELLELCRKDDVTGILKWSLKFAFRIDDHHHDHAENHHGHAGNQYGHAGNHHGHDENHHGDDHADVDAAELEDIAELVGMTNLMNRLNQDDDHHGAGTPTVTSLGPVIVNEAAEREDIDEMMRLFPLVYPEDASSSTSSRPAALSLSFSENSLTSVARSRPSSSSSSENGSGALPSSASFATADSSVLIDYHSARSHLSSSSGSTRAPSSSSYSRSSTPPRGSRSGGDDFYPTGPQANNHP